MSKKVVIIGSLDTKEAEFRYVDSILKKSGISTIIMNTGIYETTFEADISNKEVAAAGGVTLNELQRKNDRGLAVATMAEGASSFIQKLVNEQKVAGIFGMGGTAGTTVAATAMKKSPIGIPKLIISTVASGNTRPYIGEKDIMMMFSVVDIAGINSLSAQILKNGANALAGMVKGADIEVDVIKKPMIATTMFGVTTPCVTKARKELEAKGYDVLVFHATGTGGDAMEALIQDGYIEGVADITTTEFADQLVGGVFSAGAQRLESAAMMKIPQVVSVGALDMVNFGPRDTIPEQFKERLFYQHNPTTTLMRTTVEENIQIGEIIAQKINQAPQSSVVVFPKGGVSLLDREGQPFEGTQQRESLYNSLKKNLNPDVRFIEVEEDINDPIVADLIVEQLLQLLKKEVKA
ncbi:Tm-1-like ATP-binding domain-containing protein [Alkalihalobacillus sp. 1P02AB]|uniref:Tm-1-like ATP-binding domain-containing protein n=1 Tax=Alkalihalobacillus sp. 1P02AB TaxID=3132260 RepID=UPI0039A4D711